MLYFFSSRLFHANGLVGAAVLLGSFQACAICIPAAPDVQGKRAKSKPLLLKCGQGGFGQHFTGERLVSVCHGACDAVNQSSSFILEGLSE